VEGSNAEWHRHVTVAPEYRQLGLARKMMGLLEMVSDEIYRGFFVDLYVCCANTVAVAMYEEFGYSVYRRVREYYGNIGIGKGGRDEEAPQLLLSPS
jgi:N-terminal acetyltransferase B complex catalytic subunit